MNVTLGDRSMIEELQRDNAALGKRLREAEELIEVMRRGEADPTVKSTPDAARRFADIGRSTEAGLDDGSIATTNSSEARSWAAECEEPPSLEMSLQYPATRVSRIASIAAMAIGVLVLIGWTFDITFLKSVFAGVVSMKPNTALAVLIAGAGCLLATYDRSQSRLRAVRMIAGLATAAIGVFTLSEWLFDFDLGIDQLLFREDPLEVGTAFPGRMTPWTALNFMLIGVSLILLDVRGAIVFSVSQSFALLACVPVFMSAIGYLAGIEELYGAGLKVHVSLPANASFIALVVAILAARGERNSVRSAIKDYGIAIVAVVATFLIRLLLWPLLGMTLPWLFSWPAIILASWLGGFRAGFLATLLSTVGVCYFLVEPRHTLLVTTFADGFGAVFFLSSGVTLSLLHEQMWRRERSRVAGEAVARSLREANSYYRSLIEASLDPLVIKAPDGTITDLNTAMENVTGRTRAELVGTSFFDCFTDPVKARRLHQQVRGQGSVRDYPLEIRNRNGTVTSVLYNASVFRDRKGAIIGAVAIARDTTERNRAEAALRESEERFRRITVNMLDMVSLTDAEGIVQYATPSNEQILGYRLEEMIGKSTFTYLHPEDRDRAIEAFRESVAKQIPGGGLFRFRHADGHFLWLEVAGNVIRDESGNVCGTVLASRDVTERREAEQQTFREKLVSDTIIEGLPGVYFLFDETGRFLRWNKNTEDALGRSSQEISSAHPLDFVRGKDREKIERAIRQVLQGESVAIETDLIDKNGQATPYYLTAHCLVLDGRPLVSGMGLDISERRTKDQQLRLQAAALESAANAIVITDRDGGIVWVNPAYTKMTGYSFEEVRGKNPRVLKSGRHDPSFYDAMWTTILSGKVWQGELVNRRKNGELYDDEMTITPVHASGDGISHFVAIKQDVTERRQSQMALRQSEERFRLALKNSPFPICLHAEDGEIIQVSDCVTDLTGYSGEQLANISNWISCAHDADQADVKAAIDRTYELDRPIHSGEYTITTRTGERLVWDFSAAPLNRLPDGRRLVISMAMDVTERKRAERALHESEERFALAIQGANDGIWDWKIATNELYFSARFKSMIGYEDHELNDTFEAWEERLHPDDRDLTLEHLRAYLEGRSMTYQPEYRLKCKDGVFRWFQARATAIRDANGMPTRMTGSLTDITDRKQAEEDIRRLNSELEQMVQDRTSELVAANKELESFAYSVSHDLRAPLRAIDGFSQALLEDYDDKLDGDGKNYLQRVRAASQRMGHLIDDILQLSRMTRSAMNREDVNLSEIALHVISDLQAADPARRIEIVVQPDLHADGDARLLEVVFANLLGNAWKFTNATTNARIEFGATYVGDVQAFYVRDNGAGFDMTYAHRLFGAFQRLHSEAEFPGTGIGLATVKRIITRHGGSVWAEGEVGKGATFTFTLRSGGGKP